MEETVYYQVFPEQGYGLITINRPEKRNAISLEMADNLLNVLLRAENDPIKFLVITGAGSKMFCSGGDLNDYHGELSEVDAGKSLRKMMEVLYLLTVFKLPTICLLNGGATGGGCELATACDIRIAKKGTKFGYVQTKLGIIPGWGGGVLLAKKVHPSFANQWIMEGNNLEDEQLERKGWIHRIVTQDEFENKDKLLKPYIEKSNMQMEILKGLFLERMGVSSLKKQMEIEVDYCASLWESDEHKRAVLAFMNRN